MGVLEQQKEREPIESTDGVPAKNPPKVKSVIEESSRTQECKSWGEYTYLEKFRVWCLYSSGELTQIP